MKLSKSKLALAKVINENGGWVDGAKWAAQDKFHCLKSNVVAFYVKGKPRHNGGDFWRGNDVHGEKIYANELVRNWHQACLSREEYYQAYPKVDADGWIEWNGGECPVDEGTLIDVRYRDGHEQVGCGCGVWRSELYGTHYWLNSGGESNIIAYRLHKPGRVEIADFNPAGDGVTDDTKALQDAVNSMTKPTIEQLAADYRNAKDYSGRKQQEADAAKADAEAKLYLLFNPLKREFEDIADEMIKWLCENGHPHMTVIITNTHAELVEGIRSCVNDSHLKR